RPDLSLASRQTSDEAGVTDRVLSSQGARTDRPYVVCDRCGHLWSVWVEPTVYGDCDSRKLWFFPTVAEAVSRSRLIRPQPDFDPHLDYPERYTDGPV